ncbi:MAG: CBS domain-containing protein [Actinomycetota bacterium]|nr:CBS domain-containing protein [Actinomycetota bacterium]
MSPRAAWRLEGLGFSKVYDYAPSKVDWFAAGLPMEGELASVPTVGDVARRGVPTCAPEEKVGEVRDRIQGTGWDRCVVVNEERVVLGLLREKELAADPETTAEEAMRFGPTTVRPDVPAGKMAERMQERGTASVVVTTPDGELVGLMYREDAERPYNTGSPEHA